MRLAVDTNILARALTDDPSDQGKKSVECLRDEDVFIIDTVLLETKWVLRSRLKLPRSIIEALFSALMSRRNVTFADRARVADSIFAYRSGLDFADAMHLHAADGCAAMLTYDEDFMRRARRIPGAIEVKRP